MAADTLTGKPCKDCHAHGAIHAKVQMLCNTQATRPDEFRRIHQRIERRVTMKLFMWIVGAAGLVALLILSGIWANYDNHQIVSRDLAVAQSTIEDIKEAQKESFNEMKRLIRGLGRGRTGPINEE